MYVYIIDCTEIFIKQPQNQLTQAQVYSNYKSHNTIKYLTGITPAGAVSFLSYGWGRRDSDKRCWYISTLICWYIYISTTSCWYVNISRDVDISQQIAHVQIHVEYITGQLKKFKILGSVIPICIVDLHDEIMTSVHGLINLSPSVVNKRKK